MLDAIDKKIIAMMQEEFPLVARPYQKIANMVGISEEELLKRLSKYRKVGKIRKMGAVLKHREVGYSANALCAWIVPEERIQQVGVEMSRQAVVTHCYARVTLPDWPYNFYTMLHAHTREECRKAAAQLAEENNLQEYIMLFSTKEWKKASMRYFGETEAHV